MPSKTGDRPVCYWDSCVPLAYIADEDGRAATIEEMLRRARAGDVVIVTSVVTIAEVAYAADEKAERQLDPAVEDRIEELWKPASPIKLVEFYRQIGTEARDLMRAALVRKQRLTPVDAIHLATARRLQVAEFHTYDEPLRAHAPFVGLTMIEPTNPQAPLFDEESPVPG
jgi:predicted nucleic acid-binding protein